jgi:type I restriction-modification system DNA methylase subunit
MAPQPTIGRLVDDAMSAIERDNPSLKGVLPKDYARPGLDKQRLGQLINLVSDISFHPSPSGNGAPSSLPLPPGGCRKSLLAAFLSLRERTEVRGQTFSELICLVFFIDPSP